eukprot:5892728-Pleurochrysis_carterae.AAC.1
MFDSERSVAARCSLEGDKRARICGAKSCEFRDQPERCMPFVWVERRIENPAVGGMFQDKSNPKSTSVEKNSSLHLSSKKCGLVAAFGEIRSPHTELM